MRILAVDDDPVILDLLEGSLGSQDHYDLRCCDSGEAALELVGSGVHFDCFLLDIMMPGLTGIDLCRELRGMEEHAITPIVVITASKDAELMTEAFHAGATDFLNKPLDGIELAARINAMAMLSDSLRREREARASVAQLSAAVRAPFEAQFALANGAVSDLVGLENDLLRLPAGVYAMSLFALDVSGLRGVHANVHPEQFRAQLELIAQSARGVLDQHGARLAYAGGGRFVGLVKGRGRLPVADAQAAIEETISANWDTEALGTPMTPEVTLKLVGDQRIWSGIAASDSLRAHLTKTDVMREAPPQGKEYKFFGEGARRVA